MKVKVFKIRISDEFLFKDQVEINDFIEHHDIVSINSNFIEKESNYWSILVSYEEKKARKSSNKLPPVSEKELSKEEMIIYNKLKDWRFEKSTKLQVPAYIIFHNAHLIAIAKYKPYTLKDLQKINGLGNSKVNKYGLEITEVLENI